MKVSNKTVGFAIIGLSIALLGTAATADRMGMTGQNGMGHMGHMAVDIATMDADKDGKLTAAEITAFHAAEVAAVDANKDGKLSVDELAAMRLKQMTDAAKAMATQMVAKGDTDGDALLSAAEILALPQAGFNFDALDTNKDGFIDQAEIDAAMAQMQGHGPDGRGHSRG